MDLDPTTTKYLIKAEMNAEGVVEKSDVIGAIFGQTEGLLGDELDLRDLQKSGRIGRIEVTADSKKGKTHGEITMPSSLDKVETAILAAALETIDRVGPCKAEIRVKSIEDVRISKRGAVADRAKVLLQQIAEESKDDSGDLIDHVKDAVRIEDLVSYGAERLPAGPNVASSDAILVVEGRNDVANLLKNGIKNAIATEGTSIPKSIVELAKEKVVTAFVDGDRGGELLLKELLQVAEVDFVARAPRSREVEELTQKQLMKCLRNKQSADQYLSEFGMEGVAPEGGKPRPTEARGEMEQRQQRGERDRRPEEREGRPERRDDRPEGRQDRPGERQQRGERDRLPERRDERPQRREERGGRERRGDFDRRDRRPERREERPAPVEPVERAEVEEPFQAREGFDAPVRARGESPFEAGPDVEPEAAPAPVGPMGAYRQHLDSLAGKLQGVLLDDKGQVLRGPLPVRELADTLKKEGAGVRAVVFDGVITQRLLDIAVDKKIATIVGVKLGNITKQPTEVQVHTRADL